jgi:RNA polymerase sigma-70 factor (ECF subfamily)
MPAHFEGEVLPHLPTLRRAALRLVREQAAAEDLVQHALLRACRFWHLYRPGTNVRAWLMTILRHCFISDYRKTRRAPVMTELHDSTHAARDAQHLLAEAEGETGLMDQTVLQAIEELRPEYRQALLLSDLEGLSLVEISRRVGIPVGTAKSRIFRARRQARAKLRSHAHAMGYITPGRSDVPRLRAAMWAADSRLGHGLCHARNLLRTSPPPLRRERRASRPRFGSRRTHRLKDPPQAIGPARLLGQPGHHCHSGGQGCSYELDLLKFGRGPRG